MGIELLTAGLSLEEYLVLGIGTAIVIVLAMFAWAIFNEVKEGPYETD